MKLLVFAHTPPPHHGQSYMVKLMVEGFGGDRAGAGAAQEHAHGRGIDCFHVNAKLSRDAADIGGFRPAKLLVLFRHCLHALRLRAMHGADVLYYVPAPGKSSAVFRDWMVMLLCRPFFRKTVFHWHAAGLSRWLETVSPDVRAVTHSLLREPDLSIVLSNFNRADAEAFRSKDIAVVPIGIPDPCVNFDATVALRREARAAARRNLLAGRPLSPSERERCGGNPEIVEVLYLAHCLREKGIFDALDGMLLANRRLAADGSPLRLRLKVGGAFFNDTEKAEFQTKVAQSGAQEDIRWLGFVAGEEKDRCLREADLLCFPTYYSAENQPVTLIEAMAYGLPVVTTRWRSLPEMLPAAGCALVEPQSPQQVADALRSLLTSDATRALREHFQRHFTLEQHLRGMAGAIRCLEERPSSAS